MYTGHKIAIVSDISGTTRDIVEFDYNDKVNDLSYIIADSGGLDLLDKNDEIAKDIVERTKNAIRNSDILVWLIEYDRVTELDEKILKIIREENFKDVIVVANKADNEKQEMEAWSLAWTGWFENFFPVSVTHNKWISDVKSFIAKKLTQKGLNYKYEEIWDEYIKLAIIGRPNVGKSSLVNAITWEDRVMVKDLQGTTRDSVDSKFEFEGNKYVLIDTAWIRRPWKIGSANIEDWSIMRTDRAIDRADVVAIIIDGIDGIVHQDQAIIQRVLEEDKGIILVVNKWDAVLDKCKTDEEREHMMEKYIVYMKQKIEFLTWAPVIFSSATEWRRVKDILSRASEIRTERTKRVRTWVLNNFLEQVIYKHPPTWNRKSHKPKIYFATQAEVNPPRFVISVNNSSHFHFSYRRYIENKIRENFWFYGTPVIVEYKQKDGAWRYKNAKKK